MTILSDKPDTFKLPLLRKGITFTFNGYDKEGKPHWLIHDAGRNKFFIIGWAEYELLERWSLGDAKALVEAVNQTTTLNVELKDVENLVHFLSQHYLIQQSGYRIFQQAKEQKLFKDDNWLHWLINYYLFFRIPLCHPDNFLVRTRRIGELLFNRMTFWIMSILAVVALYQLSTQWDKFIHTFSSIFTFEGLVFSLVSYLFIKSCHELGHAYMCRRYGIPVPTLGIAFLVFWPVLYTDTTLSWSLNNKQRLRIALAGILVETYITIFAALIWCNVSNLTIQSICYVIITVNWIASLLINASPFMRFDGYYVLADFLNMPNLQPRAFALTRWQIRRWLFHWPDPPPEQFSAKRHHFLIIYSLITWVYRLFVYFGIALLVYHFFIKVVGIVLFAIELFYFILAPIVGEIQRWIVFKDKFSFNIRTKLTCFFVVIICLLFFLPIQETIRLPGTLSYKHQFLIAPTEGILESTPPPVGSVVKANQTILQIRSPELDHAIYQVQLAYEKKMEELRRASINLDYSGQKRVILSDINKDRAQFDKLMSLRTELALKVPFNGVIKDIEPGLVPGTFIMTNEWLGDVIAPDIVQVEAFVSQRDINNLKVGLKGYFYPNDLSQPKVPIKVAAIEVINASKLNCSYAKRLKRDKDADMVVDTECYNVSELGGDVATFFTEEGEYVPVNSVFRVLLTVQKPVKLTQVERGVAFIETVPDSYSSWLFYKLKTIWIQQTGF